MSGKLHLVRHRHKYDTVRTSCDKLLVLEEGGDTGVSQGGLRWRLTDDRDAVTCKLCERRMSMFENLTL